MNEVSDDFCKRVLMTARLKAKMITDRPFGEDSFEDVEESFLPYFAAIHIVGVLNYLEENFDSNECSEVHFIYEMMFDPEFLEVHYILTREIIMEDIQDSELRQWFVEQMNDTNDYKCRILNETMNLLAEVENEVRTYIEQKRIIGLLEECNVSPLFSLGIPLPEA